MVTPSKPSPPYEQLLPLPTPYFKMFLERSFNDPPPPPPHFNHLSLLPPPHPPPLPPLKILIIHLALSNDLRSLNILSNTRLSIPHLGGGVNFYVYSAGGRKFFDTNSAGKLHPTPPPPTHTHTHSHTYKK